MVFFKISQNLQESSVTFPKCLITPFYRTTPDERSYRNRLSLMKRCGCNAYCFGQIRLLVKRVSVIHLVDEFFFCFLVQLKEARMLGESKSLSFCFWCLSDRMRKGGEAKISFSHSRGSRVSTQNFCERGGIIQCVWSV